jgi:hypothetical protein
MGRIGIEFFNAKNSNMKYLITALLFTAIGNANAYAELRLIIPYTIMSDSVSADVPEGFCKIKGLVTSSDTSIIREGIIANYGMTHKASVIEGSFELLIPDTDSIVFFYSPYYNETIINPYNFKSGHEVTINFYPVLAGMFIDMDKPVIYCYSDEPLSATIDLNIKGDLTFSYPAYKNGWTLAVDESGTLKTENGKSFPYLFWEGETTDLNFQANSNNSYEGFYIQTDSVIDFLEEQLTALGLNRTEQTDFITYWAPRMIENEHIFLQFMIDEAYAENIATINIMPRPDQLRRVYMLFTTMDEKPDFNIIPQKFETIDRGGFTVIEWGGSEIIYNIVQL